MKVNTQYDVPCVGCGSLKARHHANKMCKKCYMRVFRQKTKEKAVDSSGLTKRA